MDTLSLIAGNALVWWLGIAFMLALPSRRAPGDDGEVAWTFGAGYLIGAFLLTLWLRALSFAGVKFSAWAVVAPLVVLALLLTLLARRRTPGTMAAMRSAVRRLVAAPDLAGAARLAWWSAIAWLALRFTLLAIEVATRPLYPWDAWTQWATKARVWYELGGIVPFARAAAWLAANGSAYFDASPEYPPTMPLLQVYESVLLGRWDDTLMNGPWWQIALALTLAVYGGLRSLDVSALAALAGAFLVASLPLANAHVALAGYADLPLAAAYVAAALALLRWLDTRSVADALAAVLLAIAMTQIKNPGWFWSATLVPGVVVARWPRQGPRIALAAFAAAAVLLVVLARFQLRLFNYDLRLSYAPAWGDLFESYFLLGNWHLLWYGALAVAGLAWRSLTGPRLAPLTAIVVAGLLFLFVVFGFTSASYYITDQTTVNRATLHLAPLIVVFMILAWQAFSDAWVRRRTPPATPIDSAAPSSAGTRAPDAAPLHGPA